MLDLPIRIPRLIYYSTEDTMFIWLFDRDQPDTYRQLKTKIQNQLNIFIIGKNSIQELEKQFEQKRTTGNVIIICSPQIYKETAQMKERFNAIKRILIFALDDTFEADFQVFQTDLFINQQQQLIMYINQLKIVSPTAKLLPNFMFLTTKNRMSEVTKSRNMSNTLYAMLHQQNSKQTDSLIIDQLEEVIGIVEEQNISYKVKSEKSKKFIEQLRNGLSLQDAIKWYTEDSIVNKLVNNLLRSALFSTEAFYIQPYFKILFNSILKIYEGQNSRNMQSFKCYRGGKITEAELENFIKNKSNFVQNLGFLSTTLDSMIAVRFCLNVIFQIQVFPQSMKDRKDKDRFPLNYGYAQISKYSQFYSEEQILFNPLNCFKVIEVEKGHTEGQWLIKLMSRQIEKKQTKPNDDGDSEEQKIEEILSDISEETMQIKCQGNTFNHNYDMGGFLEYWSMYLKLLESKNMNCPQIRLKKISALIKIAQYQNYIGAIKKPQEIIGEAYKLIFDSDLSVNHIQSQQNHERVLKMSQEWYNLYTLMISEAAQIWIKKGLFSKCIRTLEVYLRLNQAMEKNPSSLIVQKLILLHLQAECFSKAPALYKRYVCGRQIQKSRKDSRSLLITAMTSVLTSNENTTQGIAETLSQVLFIQKETVGYNDFNYLKMLFLLKRLTLVERRKLDEKQELMFSGYFSLSNQLDGSNQNFILFASTFLTLEIKMIANQRVQCFEKGKKFLRKIQEKVGKFNYYYLQLNRKLIFHSILVGNTEQAERQLIAAIKIFVGQSEIYNVEYWKYLQHLFFLFYQIKKYEVSYKIVIEAIKLQQETSETQNFQYLNWMNKQVMSLSLAEKLQQANPIIDNMEAAYKRILGQQTNHYRYLQFLQEIGKTLLQHNDVERASNYFYKSLKICENTLNQTHIIRIKAQQKIAELHQHNQQFQKAAQIYEKCLSKKQKVCQLHYPQFIVTLLELGKCYREMGKQKLALLCMKKCISIQSKQSSFSQHYYYLSFDLLIMIYEERKQLKQAIKTSGKCLRFQIKFLQPQWKPSLIISSLSRMFLLKERQPRSLASSTEIFAKAIKSSVLMQVNKIDKANLIQKCNKFQHFSRIITNLKNTAKLYENVIRELSQLRPSEAKTKQIISFYRKLALSYEEMGKIESSIQVTKRLIQTKFQLSKQKNPNQFLSFLILKKPQLIWKSKIRMILQKQIRQIQRKFSKHGLFTTYPHFQISANQKKMGYINKLAKLLRRKIKKISKQYANKAFIQLNQFNISLNKKRTKRLVCFLKTQKKSIRRLKSMIVLGCQ